MSSIDLDDVTFSYPIFSADCVSFRKKLLNKSGLGRVESRGGRRFQVDALKNICLTVRNGDRVGLLGANGAGKSSLLKLLAGVYVPDRGRVRIRGRVSALFNAQLGLDPNVSGAENVYLAGLLLGLSIREIDERYAEIISFADLGEFIDMPLRTYSQGMIVRLAFSIATVIDAEILLLDEWIGAFDAKFGNRARKRMLSFAERARILVLASHRLDLIAQVCNLSLILKYGSVEFFGPVDEGIQLYRSQV